MMRSAQERGMRLAAILHDAIPLHHPNLVRREAARHHARYMKALTEADVVITVSQTVADQFRDFVLEHGFRMPRIQVCPLPAEVIGVPRQNPKLERPHSSVRVLCVSTLDPRKNHAGLIRAFNLACSSLRGRELLLELVGASYKAVPGIRQAVQAATKSNRRIAWHGAVTPERLFNLYSQCDFTVYPSVVEGFGLPILESLWCGRPCICANFGAIAETAAGGGCYTIDPRDSEQLTRAIRVLATDPDVWNRLADEIRGRRLKQWSDYALEVCSALSAVDNAKMA